MSATTEDLGSSGDAALSDALAYVRSIVDTVREPLVVLDCGLRVRSANRAFYRTFRVTPRETEGRRLYDLGNAQWDIPRLRTLLEEILPANTTFDDYEVEHAFPEIGPKVMLLNARRLRQAGTELILLAIEDVTERRRAEAERREIETRFTALVKNIKDHSIFTLDPEGRVTSWNVAAEHILGFNETEVLGRHFAFIFTPEDRTQGLPEAELRAAREHGRAEDERWHLRKGGERFWALGIVSALHDTEGRLTGFSKILRDMTAWKQAEQALREREAQLSAETDALIRLNEASSRLWRAQTLDEGLQEMLDAILDLLDADMGNLQLLRDERLHIAAHTGFGRDFLDCFREVSAEDGAACGRALRTGERTVVEDVEADPPFAPLRPIARAAGYRAVVSTPILGRAGMPLGVISAHFPSPHRPTEHELRRLDLYVRQAADFIERCRIEAVLRASAERQAFLLKLADALRPVSDPEEIQRLAAQLIGEQFGIANACYAQVKAEQGVEYYVVGPNYAAPGRHPVNGRFRLADFPAVTEALHSGRTIFAAEVASDPALRPEDKASLAVNEVATFVMTPLVKDGRLVAVFAAYGPQPRAWPEVEVALLEEVAERTWAAVERARIAAALQQSEGKYRSLFDSIDEGFCIIEMIFDGQDKPVDYRFLTVNPAFERQTGLADAEGRTVRELVPAHEVHWFEMYGRVALSGEATRFQNRAAALRRWYDVYAWRYGEPQDRQVAVLFNDVTARKQAEEALQEANRRKDAFLATLAHELRNPLMPIRSGLDLLEALNADDAPCKQPLQIIDRQLDHLVHLVDDLLDLSRISRGKIQLRKERLDLAEIIDAALEISDSGVTRGDRHLIVSVPSQPLTVEGDRVRLVQIVSNLLTNAVKFTDPNGQITLAVVPRGDQVAIRVQDDGQGIPRERLAEIFEMFAQAEPGHRGGLGIGLNIVRSLVAMHGGSVVAESDGLGRGATFTVSLPLCRSAAVQPVARAGAATERALQCSVLVVDDNPDIAESLRLLLMALKAEVRVAHDGAEALRTCAEWQPTHVLMDLGMPGMDGYEAARRLRAQHPERTFRLIAISGWGQDEDRERTREAGFDVHLVKPVGVAELMDVLFS